MVKRYSIHTYGKYVKEIQDICRKHGFVPDNPTHHKVMDFKKFMKYGLVPYRDVEKEWCPDEYFCIYLHEDKNTKSLEEIDRVFYRELYGTDPTKYCKTFYYKYDSYDYTKRIEYRNTNTNECITKFPIYIVSYGRYDDDVFYKGTCMTLEKMKVRYYLCVVEWEVEKYEETLKRNKCQYCVDVIFVKTNEGMGSTPQRNKCWEHAKMMYPPVHRHWVLDDNIDGYFYYNRRKELRLDNGAVFRQLEDFAENVEEPIALISHNYFGDTPATTMRQPFKINCKNFSSILINHRLLDEHNIKWRLPYNEDIDLGLQVLEKGGLYTVGFDIFLAGKNSTKNNKKGGNKEIYKNYSHEGFQKKLDCLMETWKHKEGLVKQINTKHIDERPHHKIDWSRYYPRKPNTKTFMDLEMILTPKQVYDNWLDIYGFEEVILGNFTRKKDNNYRTDPNKKKTKKTEMIVVLKKQQDE